jgi:hypothetical protein
MPERIRSDAVGLTRSTRLAWETLTHQDERVTYAISEGSWLFRRFDTDDDETPFRFSFLRWVKSGDRDDFAAIEIVDSWTLDMPMSKQGNQTVEDVGTVHG